MLNRRWIGLLVGITIALVVLGVALGVTVGRVSQSTASTLTLSSSAVLSSGDLGLWHDKGKTNEVTSLQFEGFALQPPLRSLVTPEVIYVENLSTADLFLVKPCGAVVDTTTNKQIGTMDAQVYALDLFRKAKLLGNACDWPPTVKLATGDMVRAELRIDLVEGLASGDYAFQTVFEASSNVSRIAFASDRDGNAEIYVMMPTAPTRPASPTTPLSISRLLGRQMAPKSPFGPIETATPTRYT